MLPFTLASTAQPAAKSALQSGAPDASTNSLDKPGGEIRPPDFALPPQTETVSGSIPPPQANSLQFKAGSLGVALSTFKGSLPLPDFIGRANLFVAAHRVGYAGNGLLGNATRALAGIGQLFDPYASADTLSTVLRTVKSLGNAGGYAIDFSRVDDKRAAARNYLCAPRRQGGYLLAGGADPHDPVELRALRAKPRNAANQTTVPARSEASTQTGTHTKDADAQAGVRQVASSTQTLSRAGAQVGSQAGPALRERGVQTQNAVRDSGVQTDALLARDAELPSQSPLQSTQQSTQQSAQQSAQQPPQQSTRRSTSAVAGRWTASQTERSHVDRPVQIDAARRLDAGVQVPALERMNRGTQAAPLRGAVATQTPEPDRATRGSQSGPERSSAATQTVRHATDRSTQADATQPAHVERDAAAQPKHERSTQTPTHSRNEPVQTNRAQLVEAGIQVAPKRTERGSHAQIDSARAATQVVGPDTVSRSVQAVPPRISSNSQTVLTLQHEPDLHSEPAPAAIEKARPLLSRADGVTQTAAATHHHVAGQTEAKPVAAVATQTPFGGITRATQSTVPTSDKATRTPDGKQTDVGSQTASRESDKQIQASQRELDSALSARARRPTPEVHVPASVKGNVHWLPIDAAALASSGHNARMHAGPNDVVNLSSDALGLAGDAAATLNVNANRVFAVSAKTLSLLSTAVGLAPSAAQLSSDVIELIRHPDSAQAKWNVANGALQLGAGLAAAAASFVFPPAALAPLLFPNLAEIGRALDLHQDEQVLRANGLATEADAVHGKYVNASLDATPLVNWFSSFYTRSLRPEIERFEMGQGNRPGAPPMGELPPAARGDPRVVDFYGQALRERMHILEGAAQAYLQQIADTAQLDSVTLVSRSPQMFGWPANGQPMRVFDRAVALTWSRASGTVHGMFFGKDVDGCFRLPVRTEGVTTAAGKKNLVVVSDMLDSERKAVRFDLAGFRADTSGSIRIYDPRGYTV